jgi:hypothetical protein
MGKRPARHEYGTVSEQKGTMVVGVGTKMVQEESNSRSMRISEVRVCVLSANPMQAPHVYAEVPCHGEAAIMMCTDTKKDAHIVMEIHYNDCGHEQTPRGGG